MELELIRTYFPNGTNGELFYKGERLCFTIELPWLNNKSQVSCIPEGRYELQKRYSDHFEWHLQLKDVNDRLLILIHPANDAVKELKGCIAPVSILSSEGKGRRSNLAFYKLVSIVYKEMTGSQKVFLIIKSFTHELN